MPARSGGAHVRARHFAEQIGSAFLVKKPWAVSIKRIHAALKKAELATVRYIEGNRIEDMIFNS
jgi:hypothetical protein